MRKSIFGTLSRALTVLGLAATMLAAPVAAGSQLVGSDREGPWGNSAYEFSVSLSEGIFMAVNVERQKAGLPPLRADRALGLVAGSYAGDMITGDFFGHFAPDGRDLKTRLDNANVRQFTEVAENLWTAQGRINWYVDENTRLAIRDWMNSSEGHREAILDRNLTMAGVGTAIRDERIAVAMLFGR